MVESDNPSYRDERSTQPYNEDKVSSAEMLARLKREHPDFKGDWRQLEHFVHSSKHGKIDASNEAESWNEWAKARARERQRGSGEFIHLEGADFDGLGLMGIHLERAHLEDVSFFGANLERAMLRVAHLERANLQTARLQGADVSGAYLREASLVNAELEDGSLANALLEQAELDGACLHRASLAGANMSNARLELTRLEDATLTSARLEGAWLARARLDRAKVMHVHFDDAKLYETCLEDARLIEACFTGAKLDGANFDGANLRAVSGLRFDSNRIHRTQIDGNAKDPWSVLRRKYTGPWFFVHMLLLIVFFAPYAAKFLYLSGLSHGQTFIERQADALEQKLDEYGPAVHAIREIEQRYKDTHERRRAVWVLLGWTEGWWACAMAGVLVLYNAIRAFLTLRISALRDAEERSQVTPALEDYWRLFQFHCWVRLLMYIAIASALFNVSYWVCTTWVHLPKAVS
jgi:uncharacterized protein YjbI with pentapeptide repeats